MPLVKESIPPTPSRSVIPFSVASLQQYTDSFSEANIILEDKLGKIYRADIPDGKVQYSALENSFFQLLNYYATCMICKMLSNLL